MAADPEPGSDLARFYDLDLVDHREDIDLYLALAGRGGLSILELGCGSGRVAIPLAHAGNRVTGVDNDRQMLARARAAWDQQPADTSKRATGSLELVEADVLKLALDRTFDLVVVSLNLLPLLGDAGAQAAALAVAARHANADSGRVVIDLTLPSAEELSAWDGSLALAWQRTDDETGNLVAKTWAVDYDSATQVAVVNTYFDSWPPAGGALIRVARRDKLHLLSAGELRALVGAAGLDVEHAGGDYAMTEFGPGSERIVLVCSLL